MNAGRLDWAMVNHGLLIMEARDPRGTGEEPEGPLNPPRYVLLAGPGRPNAYRPMFENGQEDPERPGWALREQISQEPTGLLEARPLCEQHLRARD